MNITYRREFRHNYLIFEPDELPKERYVIGMLSSNCMEGLLKFHVKTVDSQQFYYYEITSKQPLGRLLESHSLTVGELRCLIGGLFHALEGAETYLLSENQILLEQDYIFINMEDFAPYLCIIPGRDENFSKSLTKLLQFLLGKIDHGDKECVILAYGLYQASLKENYGLDDLMRLILKKETLPQSSEVWKEAVYEQEDVSAFDPAGQSSKMKCDDLNQEGTDWQLSVSKDREYSKSHKKIAYGREIAAGIGVAAGGPGLFWLLGGAAYIRDFWYILVAADVIFTVFFCLKQGRKAGEAEESDGQEKRAGHNNSHRSKSGHLDENGSGGGRKKKADYDWMMDFEEDNKEELDGKPIPNSSVDDCQTILLSGSVKREESRCLKSLSRETEDIQIAYVPYLIGRQEGLADYVLKKDGISRLHVKIDSKEEIYYITDLNSTNGTSVNGRGLEANETVRLGTGDEVYIANVGYVFT